MLDGIWLDDKGLIESAKLIQSVSQKNIASETKVKKEDSFSLLPSNLLLDNDYATVWYTEKPVISQQWYRTYKGNGKTTATAKVPHPKLIFVALKNQRKLCVFAFKNCIERPDLGTQLFHAPLANMYADMSLCIGSAEYPPSNEIGVETIPVMQAALFNSNYTGYKFASLKTFEVNSSQLQPAINFWNSLEGKTEFPDEELLTGKFKTLGQALKELKVQR